MVLLWTMNFHCYFNQFVTFSIAFYFHWVYTFHPWTNVQRQSKHNYAGNNVIYFDSLFGIQCMCECVCVWVHIERRINNIFGIKLNGQFAREILIWNGTPKEFFGCITWILSCKTYKAIVGFGGWRSTHIRRT